MPQYTYLTADVFTDRRFGGNPLAVFPDAGDLPPDTMQAIARELNLSETVFVSPDRSRRLHRDLRIFTPAREVPFAGHPTIGTAFVLATMGDLSIDDGDTMVVLGEQVGPVPVRVRRVGAAIQWCELSVAQLPELRGAGVSVQQVAEMLRVDAADIADGAQAPVAASCGLPFVIVTLRDARRLDELTPDPSRIVDCLADAWAKDLYVVAEADPGIVRARMFAPVDNIAEDPATGSAAAALAGVLAQRDGAADGELNWTVHQGEAIGRPSTLRIAADRHDGRTTAVRVRGQSVMVAEGRMWVDA